MSIKQNKIIDRFSLGVRTSYLCILGVLALGMSQQGQAAPTGSCWISVNKLGFGNVNSKGASSSTAATINCNQYNQTKPVNATLCIYVPEGNPTLAGGRRRISSNTGNGDLSSYLSYDLFYDPALSQRIDTQINSSTLMCVNKVIATTEHQVVYSIPIYGKVYAGQNVKASNYTSFSMPITILYAFSEDKMPTIADVIAGKQSGSNNLIVDASFENSCVLNSTPDLNFGQVTDLKQAVSGSTAISLSCPSNTTWKVSLDNGLNYSGSSRRMKNGNQYIPYALYRGADLSQPWDSTGYSQGTGNNGIQQIQIYGKVPAQSSMIPAGDYVDIVTVTLTY